jgi:hypothetical protein
METKCQWLSVENTLLHVLVMWLYAILQTWFDFWSFLDFGILLDWLCIEFCKSFYGVFIQAMRQNYQSKWIG